jgi:hypothetical protein
MFARGARPSAFASDAETAINAAHKSALTVQQARIFFVREIIAELLHGLIHQPKSVFRLRTEI